MSEKVSSKTLKRYEERLEELGVNVKSLKEVVAFLHEQVDLMAFYWSMEKLEVCDSELTESWIVETLKPDNAQAFFSALDTFSLCWQVFSNKFEGLVTEIQRRKEIYEQILKRKFEVHRLEYKGKVWGYNEILELLDAEE